MPIVTPQGLAGLKGLGSLSKQEYDAFVDRNRDLIASHNYDPVYINNLYSNKQFIDKFGVEQFKAVPDINARNELFKEAVVEEEWDKLYNPINSDGTRDNTKGLGADYEKYSQMSTDAKQKLLESDYLSPSEFNSKWSKENDFDSSKTTGFFAPFSNQQMSNYGSLENKEARKQFAKERNNGVLETIYNDDVDTQAKKLSTAVVQAYQNPSISAMSDEQVKEAFVQAITPSAVNRGIANFAAYYGDGNKIESEMQNFSVDDMRDVLAKKLVYDQYMGSDRAATALNNEAQRYIKDHQGSLTRLGLFAQDVGISALSYTADKVNGIYNLGLMATDQLGDKPTVWVDDTGNVVDPNKVAAEENGSYGITGNDGNFHPVHQEQIDRATLHLMGKNSDGTDDTSILNPQYWTRAEQFGTLNEDEQKQWEKLGVSPHKVVYDPNEDTDLWYESFKMMSFGLADGASMFIPFGIGITGKALSTASKVGRVGRGLGRAMRFTGKALGAESGFGQVAQGMAGAGGIAYAYERGAFQETLQQNLANAEQTLADRSRNDIFNRYNNDESYKAEIDALIDARALNMKAAYIAQLGEDGQRNTIDEQRLDEMIRARAQDEVMGEQINNMISDRKNSDEYRLLQEEAINSAGKAANAVFLPEAIKYGLVNTIGFRKWLYSNPASLQKKAGKVFSGLREMTTSAGRQRLAAKTSEFLTRGDKIKQFGKTLGSQVWGGAWTNGTDDMMVDAAERINEDSFNRYLNAYANGESLADIAGYNDGLYSYWMGLNNSLGQETTWNAAAVGGIGSVVSFTPNMANIAHLATKEGRQAYKDRYMREREYETDENGFRTPKVDKQGNPVYRDISRSENWRDRFNYFIQNGVLNTYYGKKIAEQDMQNHADYVNNILDDYDDFKVIEDLISSDNYLQNTENTGDQKTMRFVKAIHAINALNHLGNSKNDPTAMSSVVQNVKDLVDRASQLTQDNIGELFTEEETNNMIAQYYANNPGLVQTDSNNLLAITNISKNARELKEAAQAYDEAEKQIQSVERSIGKQIDPAVRDKMKLDQALNGHWDNRLNTMRDEIGDTSSDSEISEDMIIPSLGGKRNAESLIKVYEKQQTELQHELEEQKKETEKREKALKKAQDDLAAAKDNDERYKAQQDVIEAQAKVDDAHQQEDYIKTLNQRTVDKKSKVQKAIDNYSEENKGKVLTAAEIFSLDPVSRARMMNSDNRHLYSKEQVTEIENLEKELLMKDGDALQKIQDIALLTQRIKSNKDAYSRMAKNPEAAAVQLEAQRRQSADAAHKLINQRNAESVVDLINQFEDGMKGHDDVTQDQKDQFVFRALRKLSPNILDIIEEDRMLPQYQKQVADAKEWGKVVSDISAVVDKLDKDDAWKQNIGKNIDAVINSATNKQGIIDALEKVVDDTADTQASEDFDLILQGLNKLGYQRDATVLETRKQRKEREEANRKIKIEAEEARKAAAQEAAAKAAVEAEEWAAKANKNPNDIKAINLEDVSLEEQGEETSVKKAELKNEDADTSIKKGDEIEAKQDTVDNTEAEESQDSGHIIQDGDQTKVITPSIEAQVEERQGSKEQYVSDVTEYDAASANGIGEHIIDSSSTALSGRAMGEYDMVPLAEDGRIVRKKGESPNDSMNKYFAWMNAAGIKLQNIIDTELGQILRRNPNAKVKFMAVRPQDNATHDGDMKRHLMLVLDYDNSVNKGITQIHKDENGGVIESQGKKYLVIGVAGYGNRNTDQLALYDILFSNNPKSDNGYGLVRRGMGDFFRNNPSERYYVHPTLETQIVESTLIPGFIVKQLENDKTAGEFRSITELLANPERNPLGLDMESLSWGIQERTKFLVVGTSLDRVMVPRKVDENAGSAFVLVPAGNGKMVPSYLKPLMYTEMNNGTLKDRVNEMLLKITSPKYADRLAAATELSNIFYMDKDLDFILIGKDGTSHNNTISLVHNGNVFKTFVLDSNFDRQQFMNAFAEMNPRVNITASVFQSPLLLKQYDEAGALQTDIARLATAGSSYSIYGLDAKGNIIKPDIVDNTSSRNDGTYRNTGKSQVVYSGNYYHYNAKEGKYYLNGEPVNDVKIIAALDYNRRILNVSPVSSEGVWDTYILNSSEEHPEVIKINRNSKEVNVVSEEQAKKIVKKIAEEKEAKEREEAAKKAIEDADRVMRENANRALENGEMSLSEEWVVDPNTGELVPASVLETPVNAELQEKEKKGEGESSVQQQDNNINRVNVEGSRGKEGTQTFSQLAKSKKHRKEITQMVKNKWPEAPNALVELEGFLRDKGIEVDAIGTTDEDVQAWINHVECKTK